ncbi:hypothetical protein Tco_0655250 [Tanacetum coccineum]|uniref:Uncharacterized protein n=1 Tax=Tanacetum coccineum TaxID=301880 RepID=A0ABQ4X6K6_9ASTR
MSHFTILIPSDSTSESVESLASLVILSDTEIEVIDVHAILPEVALEVEATVVALPTVVLDLTLESDPEVEPSEASLSIDYVPASPVHASASPDYHPGPDTESEPFEDESEEPIEDDTPEAAEPLPTQVAPPPVQITPTSPSEPTPAPPVIPRDTRATARMTVRPQPTLPLGYRAAMARSLITSLPAVASAPSVLSSVLVDRLPPRKRFKGSPAISYQDATAKATSEPVSTLFHPGQTVEDRLDEQSGMIGGMYEHLLDKPLSKIEEIDGQLQTLRATLVSSDRENTSLHARARATELSDDSTRVSLGIDRTGLAEMRRQVRDTAKQL